RRPPVRQQLAKAPHAAGEEPELFLDIPHAESRPYPRCEIQLRVRELPEQEVADAVLASGSDQQLRLRHSPESETRAEDCLADLLRSQSPARAFPRKSLSCLNDIPAPPIADRDLELEATIGAAAILA